MVEFTSYVLGIEYKAIVERFDRMRRKRNEFTYEADITISKTEAENAFDIAVKFVGLIKEFIKNQSPQAEFRF